MEEVRREARADDRPEREPGEGERRRHQSAPKAGERCEGGDRERDPVDAGHGSHSEPGIPAAATLRREPGA